MALGSGRLDAAITLLTQCTETVEASRANGWDYRCQIPLTTALAMRGSTDEAAAWIGTLEKQRHPSWRYLDYEFAIAKAWVAAEQGAVSEAIVIALAAAETARDNRQFAPEVMCLQTATQFGERSCGARLRELEAMSKGRASVSQPVLLKPCMMAMVPNWRRYQPNSRNWVIHRCCRCGGACSPRLPAPRVARIGVGMLGKGRGVGRAVWRRQHARPA